ncbi:NADH dehydrogenase [ubiquinone] 1 beta subcomplex subunit 5, mitochondrial-like [Tigriopus californicus]|uniref:NADH dehydrogenase [ubiquinone] 1 beta subcomplex subunit 5, mitochondrial-like n=1 Tax=Tigriopus californicus TaxID=6832 RepID=UPI0027D9E99E|nr:NADH dehydrogenase [ubiquinone] 1 beta subcomplex subunit 5, mitochondrial-like [Tigriopus californicus]
MNSWFVRQTFRLGQQAWPRFQGQQVRHGGHATMSIKPSRWPELQFRDSMHLWFMLVGGSLLAVSAYTNVFVGSGTLAPIPEDHQPQEHEYYPHPITRWLVKHVYRSPQEAYEGTLHVVWELEKYNKQHQLEREVQRLIAKEGDYKAYYYIPKDGHTMRAYRNAMEQRSEKGGMATSDI